MKIKPIAPPLNPAVFIHGLGGKPEDWITGNKKMYWERLDESGWPQSYRASYAYADYNNDGEYDYQGDIKEIENNLPKLVNQLADEYTADGGDCSNGCVDLIGFSLGGMVARQYLNENPFTHKIRKLITIGSPHRGVFILEAKSWLEKYQVSPLLLGDALIQLIEDFVNEQRASDQPLDTSEVVYDQLTPKSDYLTSLNAAVFPDLAKTELLYGDIQGRLNTELFFFNLSKDVPIGDGLIQIESATGVPTDNKNVYGFSDERIFDIELVLTRDEQDFKYVANQPNIQEYRFWHENLIEQPEVIDKVFEVLE